MVTDRGLNPRRTANEDRLLALPSVGLFLVADGVGGRRAGQVASQTVVDTFNEVFGARPPQNLLAAIQQAIGRANQAIFTQSHELAELEGMATTLALVAFEDQQALIAHVGDSRVYRFDGARLHLETADHSDLGDAVRAGELTYAQAAQVQQRNVINRALGVEAEVEPDFKRVPVDARTSFLICSDGITRHVSDTEIETLMSGGAHPERVCARLKELCFARGAEDNLTAVIIDVGERRYAGDLAQDEATRPKVTTSVLSSAASPQASRFDIDFNQAAPEPVTTKMQAARNSSQTRPLQPQRTSLLSGLVQLVLLALLVIGAFFAGRYSDQVMSWALGRQPGAGAASPTTTSNGGPAANPEFAAARALFEERRYDKARDRFAEFARQDPNNAEYRYWLGRAQFEVKQYAEAAKSLGEAARLNEKLPNVYVHLALAQESAGDHKGAGESLRRAVAAAEAPLPSPSVAPTP